MNVAEAYSTIFTDYPDVVTVPQFCKMIGVSGKTGYRLIKENKIKYIQVGRSYRIPKAYVFKYLELIEEV